MDTWDVVILIVAGYVALTTLVRLMIRHRDHLLVRFRRQMAEEQKKKNRTNKEASRDQAA